MQFIFIWHNDTAAQHGDGFPPGPVQGVRPRQVDPFTNPSVRVRRIEGDGEHVFIRNRSLSNQAAEPGRLQINEPKTCTDLGSARSSHLQKLFILIKILLLAATCHIQCV